MSSAARQTSSMSDQVVFCGEVLMPKRMTLRYDSHGEMTRVRNSEPPAPVPTRLRSG